MSNDKIIKILRDYMKDRDLQHPVRCALSWCIAKLLKENNDKGETWMSSTAQPKHSE